MRLQFTVMALECVDGAKSVLPENANRFMQRAWAHDLPMICKISRIPVLPMSISALVRQGNVTSALDMLKCRLLQSLAKKHGEISSRCKK